MVDYGASLLGDDFMKMGYGPVPSKVYDIVKIASGKYNGLPLSEQFIHFVHSHIEAVPPYHLKALEKADLDFLAETEVECLDDAIKVCRSVSFEGLTDLSHDSAWAGASLHGQMPVSEIARAGGADEDTIRYIEEGIENSEYFSL